MKSDTLIFKEINIDKDHINNFVLETEDGTKNMKIKFHNNAVKDRNEYVTSEKSKFELYQKKVYCELNKRMNEMLPNDSSNIINNKSISVEKLESLIKLTSDKISVNYKLDFDYLISSIKPDISLNMLNKIIVKFIDKFKEMGILLSLDDFNYSMFTSQYMSTLFENRNKDKFNDIIKETFEKIYFECPDIITHFKYNLINILKINSKQLNLYLNTYTNILLKSENIKEENVVDKYLDLRKDYFWSIEEDAYINLNNFLDKKKIINDYLEESSVRTTNFNIFAVNNDYNNLNESFKDSYKEAIRDFYCTLIELKEYYRYEFIVKDLIKRFKEKDSIKNTYLSKEKELNTEDKNRIKIYKDYLKACKKSFFGGINKGKQKVLKLRMNEEIEKIEKCDEDFKGLEITYILSNNLNDASSIYDLLINSFSSYSYLEKEFNLNFSEEEGYDLKSEFNRFFKFLFNPYNSFLRKINALTDYDISTVIADKYKILGLNISGENILKENLDSCLDNCRFIMTIFNIENSTISLNDMNFIYNVKNIIPIDGWENINDELI